MLAFFQNLKKETGFSWQNRDTYPKDSNCNGPNFTFSCATLYWKYLIRKSLGEPAWVPGKVSDKYHPNRHPQQPLGGKANDWTETWIKPLLCYSRKLLQLAKFALPPSFGETAQAREKNLSFAPQKSWRMYTFFKNWISCSRRTEYGPEARPWMSFWTAQRKECHLYKCFEAAPPYGH